jgi:hypothetical protein
VDPSRKDIAKSGTAYSLFVWLAMVLYLAPLLVAWSLWDPLDRVPYVICLAVGAVGSLLGFVVWRKIWPHVHGWRPVFLLAWAPPLALGLGLGGNVLFDSSPASAHATTFLGYSQSQKGPSRARFASWREPGTEERVRCSSLRRPPLCIDFQRSPAVTVTTRRGALGWEWIESVEPRAAD